MGRPLRIGYPGAWHYVMNRGKRGGPVLAGREDYQTFVSLLEEAAALWNLRVAAYCLMPNRYHLLVQSPDANISRCMRHINGVYTQRFNRFHHVDGPLFRGRYKSMLVEPDRYVLQLVRYIHRSPLRAGLVESLDEYEWSSHRAYLSRAQKWNRLHREYVLSMLSTQERSRLKAYRNFMHQEDEGDILGVLEKKRWPSILGSKGFVGQVKERFFPGKPHGEIPKSRETAPGPGQIRRAVCTFYRVNEPALMTSRRGSFNEPRNVAIYLTRRLRGDTLSEVGRQFNLVKYSSVSSVIERMKTETAKDGDLRERVDTLIGLLSGSQEQT